MWYPMWGSLAWDFLSIMASSISSERVFSSVGITISKHYNHLKTNIVELLQFLKGNIRLDILACKAHILATEMGMHAKRDTSDDSGPGSLRMSGMARFSTINR